jgi:hypothetical protein
MLRLSTRRTVRGQRQEFSHSESASRHLPRMSPALMIRHFLSVRLAWVAGHGSLTNLVNRWLDGTGAIGGVARPIGSAREPVRREWPTSAVEIGARNG